MELNNERNELNEHHGCEFVDNVNVAIDVLGLNCPKWTSFIKEELTSN